MTQPDSGQPAARFRRDPRQHGGIPQHIDDDRLERLTEEERVAAGIADFDEDEVPPATDVPRKWDVTETDQYQEARAEIRREFDKDELEIENEREGFPPTRYDR
jgi:hypothetical protein